MNEGLRAQFNHSIPSDTGSNPAQGGLKKVSKIKFQNDDLLCFKIKCSFI